MKEDFDSLGSQQAALMQFVAEGCLLAAEAFEVESSADGDHLLVSVVAYTASCDVRSERTGYAAD